MTFSYGLPSDKRPNAAPPERETHPSHDWHSTSESDGVCTECGVDCDAEKARQRCPDAAPPKKLRERAKCEGCGVWHFPEDPCPAHAGDLLAAPPFVDPEALRFASMCYADGPNMSAECITRNIVEAYLCCVAPSSDAAPVARYVVGFLFDEGGKNVALIRKTRPEWQRGLVNGIGGHIENNETPLAAMEREFDEEAGAVVSDWQHFCTLTGTGYDHPGRQTRTDPWIVYFFTARQDAPLETMTDEPVIWVPRKLLHQYKPVPNLDWLIPMAHGGPDGICGNVWPFAVREAAL